MFNIFKVYNTHREIPVWVIPDQLISELGLKENQLVELKCGSLSVQARVMTSQCKERMYLSEGALIALKLPDNLSVSTKSCENGSFKLGPVIGILTFTHVINQYDFRRYIPYANRIKDNGLLYVFGPNGINPRTKTISGYHYNFSQKSWQPGEFPYPDVVMDRIYPNNVNSHIELEKVIGQNRIFNKNNLINKMDFFESLNNDSYLKEYIPETALFRETAQLESFIGKYEAVFLKPLDSMKGRGIIYVLSEGNSLVCRYMSNSIPVSEKTTQASQIVNVLGRLGVYKRPYIIQAAVKRMTYQDRPFNFRLMVVKDGSGQWLVPAVFAKLAEPEGFLTNNSSGAGFIPLKHLFKLIRNELPLSKARLLDLLIDLSVKTAEVLDKELGPLGKIGLDVVIDTSGKPWLIEANGNPGIMRRNALREYPDWSSQMYDYPLAYCHHLSGFGNNGVNVKKYKGNLH